MADHTVGKTVVVHKDEFAYVSHASIAILSDGGWIAAFTHSRRRETRMHPPSDPLFCNLLSRSADKGETWEQPYFAPDFDWSGVEVPGISRLGDGTVVLTQFRFGWYPPGLAKERRAAGEPVSINLPERGWTEKFADAEWDDAQYSWARGYHGLYAHLSTDDGDTFETVKIDTGPYRDGFTRIGVVELSDGRVAYPVTEHHPPASRHTYLLISRDHARSWDAPTLIVDPPELSYGEPHLAEVGNGELYCILRTSNLDGHLCSCRSLDGGQSWSAPGPTPMYGHPGHLLVLNDVRLLCSYGRREAPFGIRACLSEDGGRTWLIDDEIIVRDDLPNGDLGYPTTIEYEPGRLFVCYYGQHPDGVTCVQGTYVSLAS